MTDGVAENDNLGMTDGHIRPVSMEDWIARVKARLKYGIPNQRALVCEGEAGCGKSEITAQVCREMGLNPIICPGLGAQQMEEFLAMVKVVENNEGAAKILQAVHENLLPTQKLVESGTYTFEVNGKKRTIIPWIVDEIFTGNMGQMNQLRGFLTFRQSGSVRIPNETIIIGTTNPEDVTYSSRKSVDGAVMERVEVVRVYMDFAHHQTYLQKEEKSGRYPAVCRLFLRMPEQQDLWKMASPRFWHQGFGLGWMELDAEKSMPDDQRIRLFEQNLMDAFQQISLKNKQRRKKEKLPMTAQALIGRFQNFIKHGDDPHYYPISGNKVLEGGEDKEVAKSNLRLFNYWSEHSMQNFIGVTVQDMTTMLCSVDDLTKEQAKHIANLLSLCGSGLGIQLFREFWSKKAETPVSEVLYDALQGTKLIEEVAAAMAQNDKMSRKLREEKKKAKSEKKDDLLTT